MMEKLIDTNKDKDLLFLSGIILNIMNDQEVTEKDDNILPELFSTLGFDQTLSLIKFFGGSTIKIPSHEDMYISILVMVTYYKRKLEGKEWKEITDELNITTISPHSLGRLINRVDKRLNLELAELQQYGLDDYVEFLRNKNKSQ